jgi:hypothetical protein
VKNGTVKPAEGQRTFDGIGNEGSGCIHFPWRTPSGSSYLLSNPLPASPILLRYTSSFFPPILLGNPEVYHFLLPCPEAVVLMVTSF